MKSERLGQSSPHGQIQGERGIRAKGWRAETAEDGVGVGSEIPENGASEAGASGEAMGLRRELQREIGQKALLLESIKEMADLREVHVEDFGNVYPEMKLALDQIYVEKAESYMGERNPRGRAAMFEQLFLDGITAGAWLGNVEAQEGKAKASFTVDARGATKYDDIRHRVDAFATLKFNEPIVDRKYNTTNERVVLGFDVTINQKENVIREKLTKSYNDWSKLPFGFSHLDYYENQDKRGKLSMMPRYVIGVGGHDVHTIQKTAQVEPDTGLVSFDLGSEQSLITRFKVLSEMRAENKLYRAMLPDKLDSKMLQQADRDLYVVNQYVHDALAKCTDEIVEAKCLPDEVLAKVKSEKRTGRRNRARNIVEGYLLQHSQEVFAEEAKFAVAQGWSKSAEGRDTFVQIMESCRELTKAAYAGELDEYRGVMVHRRGIEFDNKKKAAIMGA